MGHHFMPSTSQPHLSSPSPSPSLTLSLHLSMTTQWHGLDDTNFQLHGQLFIFLLLFFSLFLLLTIVVLFIRWTCKYRRHAPTPTTIQPSTTAHDESPSMGLDSMVIETLPIILHQRGTTGEEEAQCSICLCAFTDQEKVKVLPECNHCFHPHCVDQWLVTQSNCPLCRSSLRVNSVGIV